MEVIRSKDNKTRRSTEAELWLNRNVNGLKGEIQTHYGRILIWKTEKETSRNREVDGNRQKNTEGTDNGTNQRQRRETEQMGLVIEHTEMVGNRRECHGKAGERWRRS